VNIPVIVVVLLGLVFSTNAVIMVVVYVCAWND